MDWKWLEFRSEGSEETMQRDRDLFRAVKEGRESCLLRFYTWREPTVSFGRTQPLAPEIQERLRGEGWQVVQRPTGGGRVYHRNDLCFSVIWRKETGAIPWEINGSYRAIHSWIRECLAKLGQPTEFSSAPVAGINFGDKWCFQNAVCSDLMADGYKIVGGAQWRDGAAALHQGSIQWDEAARHIEDFKNGFAGFFLHACSAAD